MLSEKNLHKSIETLIQRIKSLEDNDPDNPNLDKLKLQLFFIINF